MNGHFFHQSDDVRNLLIIPAGQVLRILLGLFDLISDLIADVVDALLLNVLLQLLQGLFPLLHLDLGLGFGLLLHFNVGVVKVLLLLHL